MSDLSDFILIFFCRKIITLPYSALECVKFFNFSVKGNLAGLAQMHMFFSKLHVDVKRPKWFNPIVLNALHRFGH